MMRAAVMLEEFYSQSSCSFENSHQVIRSNKGTVQASREPSPALKESHQNSVFMTLIYLKEE